MCAYISTSSPLTPQISAHSRATAYILITGSHPLCAGSPHCSVVLCEYKLKDGVSGKRSDGNIFSSAAQFCLRQRAPLSRPAGNPQVVQPAGVVQQAVGAIANHHEMHYVWRYAGNSS